MFSSSLDHVFRSLRLLAIGPLAVVMSFALASRSEAQPAITLEVDASVFMSDNPFLTTEPKLVTGALDVVLRPRIEWQVDPRTGIDFTGELGTRQYSRRYGNFISGRSDLAIRYRRNEYLTAGARAGYRRDLVSDSLTESIDFAVDPMSIRETAEARASLAWSPNAITTITGEGGWQRLGYPDSDVLETINTHDVGIGINRRMSETLTLGLRAHYTSSQIANGEDTSVKSLNAVATRRFATHWNATAQVGVEWTDLLDFTTQTRQSRARFNGSASVCYEPDRTSICLGSALRSEVSGLGGLQREFSINTAIRHRISELGSLSAEVDFRRARLPGYPEPAHVFRGAVSYEHRIGPNLYLTPNAAYLQRHRNPHDKADAFIVAIDISLRRAGR